jgi:hypothetical protein
MGVKRLPSVALMLIMNLSMAESIDVMNSAKVLRIDLEKHYIPHVEIEELEEAEEPDQIMIEEEVEDLSYA